LRNKNAMEIKLDNNASYWNEMVNITTTHIKKLFFKRRTIVYDCSLRIANPKLISVVKLGTSE